MKHDQPQFKLRLPSKLKEDLEEHAGKNDRTLTAEIVARLEQSFSTATIVASETLDLEKRAVDVRLETLASHRYMVTMHVDLLTQQLKAASGKPEAKALQDKIEAAQAELEKLDAQRLLLQASWKVLDDEYQAVYRKRSSEMDDIIDVRLQKEYRALGQLEEALGVPAEKRKIKLFPKPGTQAE